MDSYVIFEIVSMTILVAILIFDLLIVVKRPHVPSMKEATWWVVFYVSLALLFALVLFLMGDTQRSFQFITGWALEYSLSIDNLFVFIIILARFSVPREMQQRVLMIGIMIAIVLRGIFIVVGVQLVEQLSWVFYIFGAWLIYTAWKQAFGSDEGDGEKDNLFVRMLRKRVRLTDEWRGGKVRIEYEGHRYFTPMLLVIIALGTTDVIFAIDSIPAIFSVTTDPFLVFACNIFALMGLRQLYFLLGGLLDRLVYLHYGIAAILGFIGFKLVFHALEGNDLPFLNGGEPITWIPHIETWHSLVVILVAMVVSVVASLLKAFSDRRRGKDISLPVGPVDAEIDESGHYQIVTAQGASFMRPLRLDTTSGEVRITDSEGNSADPEDFDRQQLLDALDLDLDDEGRSAVRRDLDEDGQR